jgi:hypothetical protein
MRIKSGIPIGSTYGKFALRALRRSQGRRCLGCRIIDLDPTKFLTHDLLNILRRRHSNSGFMFACLSPG